MIIENGETSDAMLPEALILNEWFQIIIHQDEFYFKISIKCVDIPLLKYITSPLYTFKKVKDLSW